MSKLWGGRFRKATDPLFERFGQSLDSDRALVYHDLKACTAHVLMLTEQGVLTADHGERLVQALAALRQDLDEGLAIEGDDEDIHSWVERQLTERVGELASSLRLGRSRNDLVVTDLRLYVLEACRDLGEALTSLQVTLIERAREHKDVVFPGYTHLQRAQPVLLAHHLLAHFWALERDFERFLGVKHSADCCVLGAGALAGSSWPIAPDKTAGLLGFSRVLDNSLDAVADRDFALEFLFACATCAVHLSRLAEELVLWGTTEFGFVRFDDAWSTGSSLMPQKKNPDPAELVRGKTGLFLGNLIDLFTNLKGLPLAYNRDLQQDKPPIFRSFEELSLSLAVLAGTVGSLHFCLDKIGQAAKDPALLVTDLADYLVREGLPFAQAHELAGRSLDCGEKLNHEDHERLKQARATLSLERAIGLRSHAGASGFASVDAQLDRATELLRIRGQN